MEQELYNPTVRAKERHEYKLSKMYERFGRMMMLAAAQKRKNAYRIQKRKARRDAIRSMRGSSILGAGSY